MKRLPTSSIGSDTIAKIQEGFVEALPRIERVARFRLCRLAGEDKDEALAETIALAWKAYRDLFLKGREVAPLVGKIAEFSAKSVLCGKRLVSGTMPKDAMSPVAHHRGVRVQSLSPSDDDETAPEILNALHDNATPPGEQAVFHADYSAWINSLDHKHRTIALQLASGRNTVEVARLHGVSRGRISQLRGDLIESWNLLHTDDDLPTPHV